jgi:serine/threonine-protein kinase RsbW
MQFEIRCVPEGEALWPMRTFVTSIAREIGFPEEDVDKIELAVDEACANVIRHAYKHLGVSPDLPEDERAADDDAQQCVLRLRIVMGEDFLRISIIDHGIGMANRPPGVGSVKEYTDRGGTGGLGTYIIKNFMDEVEYDYPADSGTILTMTKYLRPAGKISG